MSGLAIITTMKAPPGEVQLFVNYHLNIGIDKLIIYVDDPEDAALEIYRNHKDVIVKPCDDEHWHRVAGGRSAVLAERIVSNFLDGIEIAKDLGCEWVTLIDGDELLYSTDNIVESLNESGADVVRYDLREAISLREDYDNIFEADTFKVYSKGAKLKLARFLGCRVATYGNTYFNGHKASKSAYRLDSIDRVEEFGVHHPRVYDRKLIRKKSRNIKLLHYDCVGYDSWNAKIRSRINGTAVSMKMPRSRKIQCAEFAGIQGASEDERRKLYRNRLIIPTRELKILGILGMTEEVVLDPKLFETATSRS
jgi:hypothetical protein